MLSQSMVLSCQKTLFKILLTNLLKNSFPRAIFEKKNSNLNAFIVQIPCIITD